MANFVVVIDPNRDRRKQFIEEITFRIAPVEGLEIACCEQGDFHAIWAAHASTPLSRAASGQSVAVIWGDAICGQDGSRVAASRLPDFWSDLEDDMPSPFDGYHAAVTYDRDKGLTVGADLLGLFPVYYYVADDVLLVGSSPELFRYHASFQMRFSPAGLVGILLISGLIEGQTLISGVKRLAAGHLLRWEPNAGLKEILQYQTLLSNRYWDDPFEAHIEFLDGAFRRALKRHVSPGETHGLLFSGGLDSRLLAGYLDKTRQNVRLITLGAASDFEAKCAAQAAAHLGLEQTIGEVPQDECLRCAELSAQWDHLAGGFSSIWGWTIYRHFRGYCSRIITGHIMGSLIGGLHIQWPYAQPDWSKSFGTFFEHLNQWGFQPEVLEELLSREHFGDLVAETIEQIRTIYEGYSEFDTQRSWCFDLYYRQRFHIATSLWRFSFGAWPVLPAVDRELLELVGALPASTIANRRAEQSLLCEKFPRLAEIPIDRNTHKPLILRPRLRHAMQDYLRNKLKPFELLLNFFGSQTDNRRFYQRIYDINGPGWIRVRQRAELFRKRAARLLDESVMKKILPPADAYINRSRNVHDPGISDFSGPKLLLGFLLWLQAHELSFSDSAVRVGSHQ